MARAEGRSPLLTPAVLPFMLPTLVREVPRGPGWIFELKWDGVRVLALRVAGETRLWSRNGRDVTAQYPEVAREVTALAGGDLALDAEIVAPDAAGRPSFERLQSRMHLARGVERRARSVPILAYVFDCLALDGRDLRDRSLRERKGKLRVLLGAPGVLRFSDHFEGDGGAFYAEASAHGVEGVVAKRADAPYRGGRRREWLKIKCQQRQEFVIGGWTDPQGTRAHLGAVHIGVYEGEALVYAGRAGSGLDAARLRDLHARLERLAAPRCPFDGGTPPRGRGHHWVRPELVCEVRFTEWTVEGQVRHPVFLGLRPEKRPREVRREVAHPVERADVR